MIKRVISAMLLVLLLCSCSSDVSDVGVTYKLYYVNSADFTEIVSVETTLTSTNTEDAIVELFNLLTSPGNKSHISVIPKSVELLGSSFIDGTCSLTLSRSYSNLSSYKLATMNFVLVNTMSGLPDVKQVSITSENITRTFTAEEFITSVPPAYYDSYTISLRYLTLDCSDTVKIEKTFIPQSDKTLESTVTELLAESPESPELRSPFPDGTRINDVYLDGTTCVLDLSSEFVTAAPHESEKEATVLFSIVDTLTELPDINRVKFLIDGKSGYGYIYYNLAFPLASSSR